jgi:hypothetical protein
MRKTVVCRFVEHQVQEDMYVVPKYMEARLKPQMYTQQ